MIDRLKRAIISSAKSMYKAMPILIGALLLVSLANALIPKEWYSAVFSGNLIIDPLIGSALGSILAGNPITSYILGGELLAQGVSLIAVTAFIVAWVTVGVVQLPVESLMLGKRFAITRNISAFFFAVIVAVMTVLILGVIG